MVECLPCMLEALGYILLNANSTAYIPFLCFSHFTESVFSGIAMSGSMFSSTPKLPVSTSSLLCASQPTEWRWLGSPAMWIYKGAAALSVSTAHFSFLLVCSLHHLHFTIFATYFPQSCLPTHLSSVGWAPCSILSNPTPRIACITDFHQYHTCSMTTVDLLAQSILCLGSATNMTLSGSQVHIWMLKFPSPLLPAVSACLTWGRS